MSKATRLLQDAVELLELNDLDGQTTAEIRDYLDHHPLHSYWVEFRVQSTGVLTGRVVQAEDEEDAKAALLEDYSLATGDYTGLPEFVSVKKSEHY